METGFGFKTFEDILVVDPFNGAKNYWKSQTTNAEYFQFLEWSDLIWGQGSDVEESEAASMAYESILAEGSSQDVLDDEACSPRELANLQ